MSSAEERYKQLLNERRNEREKVKRERRHQRRMARMEGVKLTKTTFITETYKVLVGNKDGLTFEDIAEASKKEAA